MTKTGKATFVASLEVIARECVTGIDKVAASCKRSCNGRRNHGID